MSITLTPRKKSSARSVRSSRSSRSTTTARSPRRKLTLAMRRKRRRFVITLVSFALIIAGGFGLSRFSYSPTVSIAAVDVQGNGLIPRDALEAVVKEKAAAAYLGIFSKNNRLLLPRGAIEKQIVDTYKTVSHASVSFDGLTRATVVVEERKPAALWCRSASAATGGAANGCFYMDASGYIFSEAPHFSGEVFLVYSGLVATDGATSPINTQFLSPADFKALGEFISQVSRAGMKPVAVTLSQNGDGELRLSSGGSILFSRNLEYGQTLENLQSIVTAQQSKMRGTFLSQLDYINVRFTGKAFFKLKAE